MQIEVIAEVGIDYEKRVFVRPGSGDFEQIYRAAMDVHWDRSTGRLSHPAPRNLPPAQWFRQIVAAVADEYGVRLQLTDKTIWSNISADLRVEIEDRR